MSEEEFLEKFNGLYPFERYVIKKPKKINYLFDDILLTEFFVPSVELKPNQNIVDVANENIYVKLKLKDCDKEFRLAFFDFDESIREEIIGIVLEEFDTIWQDLDMEYEDESDYVELNDFLTKQQHLQIKKYGECKYYGWDD